MLAQRALGPKLKTSAVGFGCASISGESGGYGFGAMSDAAAIELLEGAYALGVRLFDTAPIYGFGDSERRLGMFLRANPGCRKDSVIVTKAGVDWDNSKSVRIDNRPETVRRMLDQSLTRLGIDRVDVYMIHWPDPNCDVERTMEALVRLQEEGVVVSLGASNFDESLIRRAKSVAALDVIQSPLSFLEAQARESLLPLCSEAMGFMSYGTLAKGVLAGTVKEGRRFESSDVRGRNTRLGAQLQSVRVELERYFESAESAMLTGTQLAVAWVLAQNGVSTALCGSKSLAQVAEVVQGAGVSLLPAVKAKLDTLSIQASARWKGN